jgi:uncharacterized protein
LNKNLERLRSIIRDIGPQAIAVSGGVDSMTLAVVAHRELKEAVRMLHAVSPAVPADASERVRDYAGRMGWRLEVVDAGEFADPGYMSNPHDRCQYCKTDLYSTMARIVDCALVSGTNSDDLRDYRPGLEAASRHGVRHPYVEAGMDKAAVRAVARELALLDLAELPASPCLSSRVETGIRIDPEVLDAIYRAEMLIRHELAPETARCRIRSAAIVIELDPQSMAAMDSVTAGNLRHEVSELLRAAGVDHPVSFECYRMGSAFQRPTDGP